MKLLHRPPGFLKLFAPSVVWNLNKEKKRLFLTFDDGPHPLVTPKVLDLLARYRAKASFFLLGKQVEQYPELMTRIIKEGHDVGNHSWSHPSGWGTPSRDYLEDVSQAAALIPSSLFRPPYGRLKPAQLRQLHKMGYRVVMWSYLTGDYRADLPPEILLQRAIASVVEGSVVVLHDSPQAARNCLYLLEGMLDHFSFQGYSFDRLSSGLDDNDQEMKGTPDH